MADITLDTYRDITPDPAGTDVPCLSWADKEALNYQTGFNRSLLESHDMCGCFHCGRRFPTSLVSQWMVEDGEEDTGVCPYCGEDTLVVGSDAFPLTTALLTRLFGEWFAEELKERYAEANDAPAFDDVDFFRKGVPFLWERRTGRRKVADIDIWSIGDSGEGNYDCEGANEPGVYTDLPLGGVWHLRVWEEGIVEGLTEEEVDALDDEEYWERALILEHYELSRDDMSVRFAPWSGSGQAKLLELGEEYGDRLLGIFKSRNFMNLEVYVEDEVT